MKKFLELLFLKSIKGYGNSEIINQYLPQLEHVDGLDACIDLVQRTDSSITDKKIEIAKEKAMKSYTSLMDEFDIQVITIFDEEYPRRLNDMKFRRPVILYVRGNKELLYSDTFSVVGTRYPSEYSNTVEKLIVKNVIERTNRTIVSGLAIGCDKTAHETALHFKANTIAVLPSGLNVITPKQHKALANFIYELNGCLVTEYVPDAKVNRSTYVERDAIIAALGDATFVMQCAIKSGTMHTVRSAVDMHRKIACFIKDNNDSDDYAGNRYMVNEYEAAAIHGTEDLESFLETLPKGVEAQESNEE